MRTTTWMLLFVSEFSAFLGDGEVFEKKHHHHHHHHHKGKQEVSVSKSRTTEGKVAANPKADEEVVRMPPQSNSTALAPHHSQDALNAATAKLATPSIAKSSVQMASSESAIVNKMHHLEEEITGETQSKHMVEKGMLEVNGPLPADFAERFAQVVGKATNSDPNVVKVTDMHPAGPGVVELLFEAPSNVVSSVENQAADPHSQLANSALHDFLVERDPTTMPDDVAPEMAIERAVGPVSVNDHMYSSSGADSISRKTSNPVQDNGIDVDTEMPYGELEPFGREDTAQELTEQSVKQSDEMVDQLERAEVAEEKRAVFRALTRLRGAAITSFDGVARSQTGNIDEYNKIHQWRMTHPLHHLADEESDISKWAFPDNADF